MTTMATMTATARGTRMMTTTNDNDVRNGATDNDVVDNGATDNDDDNDGDGATVDDGNSVTDDDGVNDGKGNGATDDNGNNVSGNGDDSNVQRVTTMTTMAMDNNNGNGVTDGQ